MIMNVMSGGNYVESLTLLIHYMIIYYKNLDNMWLEIQKQNKDILTFCKNNKDRITRVLDNYHLADTISITREGIKTRHDYKAKGIEVYVYK
jgi:hypothetical protein